MAKKLSEMTLEELWQLFPIYLTEHQDEWEAWFHAEYESLCRLLADEKGRISHIGSTAIKGIWAKPIIDILVELPPEKDMGAVKAILVGGGYVCMAENARGISFNKGYTEKGFAERVFHLHLRYWGDHDELYFRDYMNDHPEIAKEYEQLKLFLWKPYEHDRDGYTAAKHEFVAKYTQKAKEEYKGRYLRKL